MVVFDASTLILLAKIDVLGLFLSGLAGEALVPEKVRSEAVAGDKEEAERIRGFIEDGKIAVVKVKSTAVTRRLMEDFNIDAGEAEALALAVERKADIVATDDRNAIRACKTLKLDFVTAVAVLVRAVEKGAIEKEEGIVKLKKLQSAGRYSREILDDAARRIGGG